MHQAHNIAARSMVFAAVLSSATVGRAQDQRHVALTFQTVVTKLPADAKCVDLWVPVPSDGEGQKVSYVDVRHPDGAQVSAEKKFGNRMVHHRFRAPLDGEPSVEIAIEVSRTEYSPLKSDGAAVASSADLSVYLEPTSMIPLDGKVAEIAATLDLPKGDARAAGRKVYDYLLDRMDYNWRVQGAGRGDVLWACDSKTGDCTDYHSLFIALCRSSGIPADHEFGLPLLKGKKKGRGVFLHCWARYWDPQAGWVPIDASEADKHPNLREYNFGNLSANYVRMCHGRDVMLEPPQAAGPLNMFHGPYAEVDGKPHSNIKWWVDYQEIEVRSDER